MAAPDLLRGPPFLSPERCAHRAAAPTLTSGFAVVPGMYSQLGRSHFPIVRSLIMRRVATYVLTAGLLVLAASPVLAQPRPGGFLTMMQEPNAAMLLRSEK